MQSEIAEAAYQFQLRVEAGTQIVVGVNRFADEQAASVPLFHLNEIVAQEQVAALARIRAERDNVGVGAALDAVRAAAQGTSNLLYPLREALGHLATVGEVCGVLREAWGEYRPEVRL